MKVFRVFFLSFVFVCLVAVNSFGFYRCGIIGNGLEYESFSIENGVLSGIIVNKMSKKLNGLTVNIIGTDIHKGKKYWSASVFVGLLESGESYLFKTFIGNAEYAPELIFKVSGFNFP